MYATLKTPSWTLYTSTRQAAPYAAKMNELDEDGWTYKVKERADGKAFIEMYDEEGYLVGKA